MMTEARTWRRDAPMVRSVANSRVRCATVIESVLKMTKPPTKMAIPANGQEITDDLRECGDLARVLVSLLAARADGDLGAEVSLIRSVSCSGVTPSRGGLHRVELALLLEQPCAVGVEDRERGVSERADVAVLGDADDPNCSAGPIAATPTRSPTFFVVGRAFVDGHLAVVGRLPGPRPGSGD